MDKMKKYLNMLTEGGADPAIVIDPHDVVTAPWTIFKCQFGCGHYGKNHCCPPKAPSYDKTRAILDSYDTAIPSMEACGIDVFATGRRFGLEIHTLRCEDEIRNHFGLILVE